MTFDDQLQRYFGTTDLAAISPQALVVGTERMRVDLGLEKDRRVRFALWTFLYTLGEAPELDVTFPDAEDREAARNLMDMLSEAEAPR